MIQRVTVDGRSGFGCFVDSKFKPVDEAQATLYKIVFDDGGQLIMGAQPPPPKLKAYEESEHPRDESGRWTEAGGGGGGGSGGGAVPAHLQVESQADMPPRPKEKGKYKGEDFQKARIELEPDIRDDKTEKGKQFIERWNDTVRDAPDDFKKKFLGGIEGTMSMHYDEADDKLRLVGKLVSPTDGKVMGSYDRYIDFDDKTAESYYLRIEKEYQAHGYGKDILAGNVATYQQLGMDKIDVHANIDVGGHAWARFGYVPTKDSWPDLCEYLDNKIDELSSGGSGGGYEPEDWSMMSESQQDKTRDHWIEANRDEIYDSDVDNWRDQGGALEVAKVDMAGLFYGRAKTSDTNKWAQDAIKEDSVIVKEEGQSEMFGNKPIEKRVPITDLIDINKLLDATEIHYNSRNQDGAADPEVVIDEDLTPELTDDQRDEIGGILVKAFNDEAESKSGDIDPPDWLNDSAHESASEYFESMRDRDKYKYAVQNDLIGTIETETEGTGEISDEEASALHHLVDTQKPKNLWAIADSKWGKALLIDADWFGTLDLHDKETMERFNAYVGQKRVEAYGLKKPGAG